eukprot:TRINITY_DN15683_c0_g1_i2.p1 TRINITY_DN15683_c0_g1~~TRINITY_DN15683_c0_g1_i2.p1  ORF type:complete len:133 (+),score=15.79 TRINITY_DN15683_c0_g1_i2:1-399(+)
MSATLAGLLRSVMRFSVQHLHTKATDHRSTLEQVQNYSRLCAQQCPKAGFGSTRFCKDELLVHDTTARQRRVSLPILRALERDLPRRFLVLDAYAMTNGRCNETIDARHYWMQLDFDITAALVRQLQAVLGL